MVLLYLFLRRKTNFSRYFSLSEDLLIFDKNYPEIKKTLKIDFKAVFLQIIFFAKISLAIFIFMKTTFLKKNQTVFSAVLISNKKHPVSSVYLRRYGVLVGVYFYFSLICPNWSNQLDKFSGTFCWF